MADARTFADALRALWEESGLRQDEFAARLAYRRPTVANMIRGSHLPPLGFLEAADAAFPGSRQVLEPLLREARAAREREKRERAGARTAGRLPAEGPAIDSGAGQPIIQDEEMQLFRRRAQTGLDLSGTWHAVWETTVEGERSIDTEVVQLDQAGDRVTMANEAVSPENPIGGYLWRGECTLHDNAFLMGTYAAVDPNHRQRGVLFYTIHRSGQFMVGRWVGCNYDSDLFDGLTVLAREREEARTRFNKAYGEDVLQPAEKGSA